MESIDPKDKYLDPPEEPEVDSDFMWEQIKDALSDELYEFIKEEINSEIRVKNIQLGIRRDLQNRLDNIIDRCEHGVISPDVILQLAQTHA